MSFPVWQLHDVHQTVKRLWFSVRETFPYTRHNTCPSGPVAIGRMARQINPRPPRLACGRKLIEFIPCVCMCRETGAHFFLEKTSSAFHFPYRMRWIRFRNAFPFVGLPRNGISWKWNEEHHQRTLRSRANGDNLKETPRPEEYTKHANLRLPRIDITPHRTKRVN